MSCSAYTAKGIQCKIKPKDNIHSLCFRHIKMYNEGQKLRTLTGVLFDPTKVIQNDIPKPKPNPYVKQHPKINFDFKAKFEIFKKEEYIPLIIDGDYECQCCFTAYPFNSLIKCSRASDKNKHAFCKECIKGYVESGLTENKSNVKCMLNPSDNCLGSYSIVEIKECLDEKHFSALQDQIEISDNIELAKILDNYQTCPFCSKFGYIVEGNIQYIECQRCIKKWCSLCKLEEHGKDDCGKINDPKNMDAIRRIVSETMTNALTHRCPKCSTKYIKETGCNLMTCPSCSSHSCYICGILIVPINDKKYWHFVGAGSYNKDTNSLCPLYNDGSGKTQDHGNNKYNNIKLTQLCNKLLKVNSDEVRQLLLIEMKALDVPINSLEYKLNVPAIQPINIVKPAIQPINIVKPATQPINIVKPNIQPINIVKPIKKSGCIIS